MPTNFTNQEVVMSELFFACRVVNVRNSLPDTVGLLVEMFLKDALELLILASF